MKIATACEGKNITEHFGHCQNFIIFDVEGETITGETSVPNPGHKPGFLPNFLNSQGAKVIIAGGMGGGAIDIFNNLNIEVVTGASGNAKRAVELYLSGMLKSTNSICNEHKHSDECKDNL